MVNNKRFGIIVSLLLIIGSIILFNNKNDVSNNALTSDTTAVRIDKLTSESVVIPYVKKHRKLPDYYIKKSDARKDGWNAAQGNLCDVLPGKAIGGDPFSNRERSLPAAPERTWIEADLNYKCGRRNADRLLMSSDGLIFVTYDHYKTFKQR